MISFLEGWTRTSTPCLILMSSTKMLEKKNLKKIACHLPRIFMVWFNAPPWRCVLLTKFEACQALLPCHQLIPVDSCAFCPLTLTVTDDDHKSTWRVLHQAKRRRRRHLVVTNRRLCGSHPIRKLSRVFEIGAHPETEWNQWSKVLNHYNHLKLKGSSHDKEVYQFAECRLLIFLF